MKKSTVEEPYSLPAGKQRILLVARSLQMGGVERNTVNLANTFAAMGHDVHILAFKKRTALEPDPTVTVHFFDFDKFNRYTGIGLVYDLITRTLLANLIPRSGFVWRGLYTSFYFRHWVRRFEKRFGRVDRILVRGHGAFELLWANNDPRIYRVIVSPQKMLGTRRERIYTRLLYSRKNLVVNSTGTRASLLERLDASGVVPRTLNLVPNPIPVERIRRLSEEPALLPEEPYIVHVGRLTKQKNQQLLLEAYAIARPEELLVIVGGGTDEKKLKLFARELGIEDQVWFVGEQKNPYPWMKGAKLFVLSSLFEGFGLVMAESFVCGTPVVAVDCRGGVRDILIGEQAGFIAPLEARGLAEKIQQALATPPAISTELYQRFDSENVARQFLSLS